MLTDQCNETLASVINNYFYLPFVEILHGLFEKKCSAVHHRRICIKTLLVFLSKFSINGLTYQKL